MTEPTGTVPSARHAPSADMAAIRPQPDTLADVLERVLDKGIIIAGDIRVNLLDIELLTVKIRLLVASVDKALEMGIDWWKRDPMLASSEADLLEDNERLRQRIRELESGAESESGQESESANG